MSCLQETAGAAPARPTGERGASRRGRPCSSSGGACARTRSRWSRSCFIVLLILVAIFAPLIVKLVGARPPNEQSTKYFDEFGFAQRPRPRARSFGVDDLGRDVFSRVLYGARISLEVAFIATALIVLIGVTLGMIAGYCRGWIDTVL